MMAQSSSQPQAAAAQQLQELFERVALESVTPIYDQQTAAIGELKGHHTELSGVVEEMLESIKEQLSTIASMKSEIEVLRSEKEERRVILSAIQDELQQLRLQVAAQDAIRVYKEFAPLSKSSTEQHNHLEDVESPNASTTINSSVPPSGAIVPVNSLRSKATPEFMMPPPNFRTPKSFAVPGMPSPGTVGTMMPDSTGLEFYDGPAQILQKPLFSKVPVTVDENVNKPAKRARQASIIPFGNMIITPNMEDINKQNALEPVKQMDKTLWREKWEQYGKPESLEDFIRKQKLAILQSNIFTSPTGNECKRARYLANGPQARANTSGMSVPPPVSSEAVKGAPSQARRSKRTLNIPRRFANKDVLIGREFLSATALGNIALNSKVKTSQPSAIAPSTPNKDDHCESDAEEEPQTPGRAASALMQQFGSRKTKISKKEAI